MPFHDLIHFRLEGPDGELVDPGAPTVGLYGGENVTFYRTTLPAPTVAGTEAHAGTWHAVLDFNPKYFERYLSLLDNSPRRLRTAAAHGVQYTLLVHAYSNLRMRCRLSQDSYEPGANVTVRAVLTEYGAPIRKAAGVRATVTVPDGSTSTLVLDRVEQGVYEAMFTAAQAGVHTCRIAAEGSTHRNVRFTREQVLTATTWRGGDEPFPQGDQSGSDIDAMLCNFIRCLGEAIGGEMRETLVNRGVYLERLEECLCSDKQDNPQLDRSHQIERRELTAILESLGEALLGRT